MEYVYTGPLFLNENGICYVRIGPVYLTFFIVQIFYPSSFSLFQNTKAITTKQPPQLQHTFST